MRLRGQRVEIRRDRRPRATVKAAGVDAQECGVTPDLGRWKESLDQRRAQWFGIYLGNDLIGEIELIDIRRSEGCGELRICIWREELRGQGIGSDAIRLLLDYARMYLRLRLVYLRVYTGNMRAIRCYQRCGFVREGLLRPSARLPETILLMRHELGMTEA